MLNRKNMASHGRQRGGSGKRSGGVKKTPPRRRFIISSKARREEAKAPDSNGKAHVAPGQNGHAAPAAAVGQPSVELNETIKTL
jgi:hypothetical protein